MNFETFDWTLADIFEEDSLYHMDLEFIYEELHGVFFMSDYCNEFWKDDKLFSLCYGVSNKDGHPYVCERVGDNLHPITPIGMDIPIWAPLKYQTLDANYRIQQVMKEMDDDKKRKQSRQEDYSKEVKSIAQHYINKLGGSLTL